MKINRGAHNAISSWASTGRSPAFLLPNAAAASAFDGARWATFAQSDFWLATIDSQQFPSAP